MEEATNTGGLYEQGDPEQSDKNHAHNDSKGCRRSVVHAGSPREDGSATGVLITDVCLGPRGDNCSVHLNPRNSQSFISQLQGGALLSEHAENEGDADHRADEEPQLATGLPFRCETSSALLVPRRLALNPISQALVLLRHALQLLSCGWRGGNCRLLAAYPLK